MNRYERAIITGSVLKRSPTSSVGTTYIDTVMENTNATPTTTPGSDSGQIILKNRRKTPAPSVVAASVSRPSIWRATE